MFDTTETIILCSSRNGLTMEWSTHAVGVLVTQYGENSHERISQIPPQSSYSADSEHIFCVNQDVVDIYRVCHDFILFFYDRIFSFSCAESIQKKKKIGGCGR